MSDGVNAIAKFYLFIAQNFGSTENMVTQMDYNDDGYLIKAEFQKYMKEHWEGNYTESELNQFWKKIDSTQTGQLSDRVRNLNALDESEMAKMDKQIKAYQVLSQYLEGLQPPSFNPPIDAAQFKAKVGESLSNKVMAYINSNSGSSNIEAELTSYIESVVNESITMTAADLYAHAYLNQAIKNNSDLRALGYKGDKDIEAIIDLYVNSGSFSIGDIEAQVKKIIDAYLSTATMNPTTLTGDLAKYNWNGNGLNGLQQAMIDKKLDGVLDDEAKNFAMIKDEFERAKNEFLQELLEKGLSFQELYGMDIPTAFRNSDAYKALTVIIEYADLDPVETTYQSARTYYAEWADFPSAEWADFPRGKTGLAGGKTGLVGGKTGLAGGKTGISGITGIIGVAPFIKPIINGDSEEESVQEATTKAQELYNKIMNAYSQEFANYIANNDGAGSAYREILRAVAQRVASGELKTDAQIQQAIVDALNELYQTYKIVDVDSLTATWKSNSGFTMDVNSTKTLDSSATLKDKDGKEVNPTEHLVKYSLASYSGLSQAPSLNTNSGKLTITTDEAVNIVSITVAVSVDGKQIGTNTITFVPTKKQLPNVDKTKENSFYNIKNSAGLPVVGKKCLVRNEEGAGGVRNKAIANFEKWEGFGILKSTAEGMGYSSSVVDRAIETTKNYYKALMSAMPMYANHSASDDKEMEELKTVSFTYNNTTSGSSVSTSATSTTYTKDNNWNSAVDHYIANNGESGVYVGCDLDDGWNGGDNYYVFIDYNKVVAKFIEFLKQAVNAYNAS